MGMALPTFETAVVTGASGGIGSAVVDELLRRGLTVHALALDDPDIDRLAAKDGVCVHALDIRDTAAVDEVLDSISPDVLVNNAGIIGELTDFAAMSASSANALIDINLRAAVLTTLRVMPGMLRRNHGHIFFTGSIAATRPTNNTAVYSATKAALHAFADGLRMDLFGSAIRVTVIAPGRVETNLYDATLGGHDAARSKLYEGAPVIQPSDIATLIGVALDMPMHVDVTRLEVVPTAQVFGGSMI